MTDTTIVNTRSLGQTDIQINVSPINASDMLRNVHTSILGSKKVHPAATFDPRSFRCSSAGKYCRQIVIGLALCLWQLPAL